MLRLLKTEVTEALKDRNGDDRQVQAAAATGRLAAPFLEKYFAMIKEKYPNVQVKVYPIVNEFFGEEITVSGLVTGGDLLRQLRAWTWGRSF